MQRSDNLYLFAHPRGASSPLAGGNIGQPHNGNWSAGVRAVSIKHQHRDLAGQTLLLGDTERTVGEHEKWYRIGAAQRKQIPADQAIAAAYAEFTKTTEGTPEHEQALKRFFSLLFPTNVTD